MNNSDLDKQPVAAANCLHEQVPVIDLGPLNQFQIDKDGRQLVVDVIRDACRQWGFFQVVNHAIPETLINQAKQLSARFFKLSLAQKNQLRRTFKNPWGYYNNELTKNQRDKKEVFDFTVPGIDPIYFGENRWPKEFLAEDVLLTYQQHCVALSKQLTGIFCLGLGLQEHALDRHIQQHTGFTRLNYYPVCDPLMHSNIEHLPTADLGVHHHTDAGILTVLLQDDVGGLQVYRDGYWHNVKPIENALVINTGDMMQVWSNQQYSAAMHRVLAMDNTDRYSIPFFFNPSSTSVIQPLQETLSNANPAKYRPINWGDFRNGRTSGDFADYGHEVQIADYLI